MLSPAFLLNFGIGQKFGKFLSQAKYAFSAAFLPLLFASALVPGAKQHLVNHFCNSRIKTSIDLRVRVTAGKTNGLFLSWYIRSMGVRR